jgi:hypothetical protein
MMISRSRVRLGALCAGLCIAGLALQGCVATTVAGATLGVAGAAVKTTAKVTGKAAGATVHLTAKAAGAALKGAQPQQGKGAQRSQDDTPPT